MISTRFTQSSGELKIRNVDAPPKNEKSYSLHYGLCNVMQGWWLQPREMLVEDQFLMELYDYLIS